MSTPTVPTGVAPVDPAERVGTRVDGIEVLGALSPSRAGDFLSCALLYRFRTIDRLPEEPSVDAVRGTVVHKVLEDLFDLPAPDRTPDRAAAMVVPAWEAVLEAEPALGALFPNQDEGAAIGSWLTSCRSVLARYFTLEDPRLLEPADRELYVETLTDTKLLLRGVIDRVDVASDGAIRVVDYKGLAVDTPIPTPSGWTTMAEVRVGDQVIAADGNPTRVTEKSGVHNRPCYRVTLRDGSSVICDNVHRWEVVSSSRQVQTRRVVSTDELAELHRAAVARGKPHSLWLETAAAMALPAADDLPVDPWLLGAWLGDGTTTSGSLTIGKADLADMCIPLKERWDGEIRIHDRGSSFSVHLTKLSDRCTFGHTDFRPPTTGHPTRRCAHENEHSSMTPFNLSLSHRLRLAGVLGDKHIPATYLRSGTQQRIDLLRGLMDTDGWWNATRHRAGFTTTNDRLAAGVLELTRSLGLSPQYFSKPYSNPVRAGRTWHIVEFTPFGFNPFSLPRKATPADDEVTPLKKTLSRRRVIAGVERTDSVPTQCIAVDSPDSLYLCGDGFVPTHNTSRSPSADYEGRALFQLKFYALVIWRMRGVIPKRLQLIYLANAEILSYDPDEQDLLATERKVQAIWEAVRLAQESGDWQPSPGPLCRWCSHQALCPAYGGTPPPLPVAQEPADSSSGSSG